MRSFAAIFVLLPGYFLALGLAQAPVADNVWPRRFVVGMNNPSISITGQGFARNSAIQINGQTIPTDTTRIGGPMINRLNGMIPISFLNQPGSLEVSVYTPGPRGGKSVPTEIRVVPSTQSANLEIRLPKNRVGPKEKLTLTVRWTNLGVESFYVPVRMHLGGGGNLLDYSYYLEVRRPNERTFNDAATYAADGFWRGKPTEEQLIQAGDIVSVAPGETYTGTGDLSVDSLFDWFVQNPPLRTPGTYRVRIHFSPRSTPGSNQFKIKFLGENVVSNMVTITVTR